MRIGIIGDTHLKIVEQFGYFDKDYYSTRLEQKIDALNNIADSFKASNIDLCVFLGDIFDRINPPEKLSELFTHVLLKFINYKIPVRIIKGNHDYSNDSSNLTSESLLFDSLSPDAVKIFSTEAVEKFDDITIGYAPYLSNSLPDADVLFAHIDFVGAKLDNGIENHNGFTFDHVKKYKDVFLGHYHVPQIVRKEDPRVLCVGSIFKESFTATGINCRYVVYDTEIKGIDSIDIPDKKYHIFNFDEDKISGVDTDFQDVEDSFVKVKFIGSKTWFFSEGQKILDEIKSHKPYKLLSSFELTGENSNVVLSNTLGDREVLEEYLKTKGEFSQERFELGCQYLIGD